MTLSSRVFLCVVLLLFVSPSAWAGGVDRNPSVGSGFGVHIKGDYADDAALSKIYDLGFRYVRFSIGWQDVEHERGLYRWEDMDRLVSRIRSHGLRMIIPLMGGNASYDGTVRAPSRNVDLVARRTRAPHKPESIQAFARFAAQAALRYGSSDIVWEIWNEPDLPRFWPPRTSVQDFTVLSEIVCRTMRQVSPQATIIGPALGRVPDPQDRVSPDFISTFLASPATSCLDAVSIHPYRHGAEEPEAVFKDYAAMIGIMARAKVYVPLVNSEWGYATTQTSQSQQAAYALRTRLIDMIWNVPLSIWYEWKDSRADPADSEGRFGLVDFEGQDKQAISVIADLLPIIQDGVFERQIATRDPRDILLLLRMSGDDTVLVGWSLRKDSRAVVRNHVLSPVPALLARGKDLGEISVSLVE